jgi:pimeloyl-ACP methyl ester carboxylesterase
MNEPTALPTTLFLERAGGRLSYDVTGSGPLVVAAPGLGDLRASYRFVVPDLVAAGYRVATVDLRGHGSSSTGWSDYSETAVAEDLIALVEHLAAPGARAVLIGNSYSGGAAVVAAASHPALVAGLVLSGAFVRDVPQTALQKASTWLVARTPFGRRLWNAYVPSLYPGNKPADFPARHAALKTNLAEPGRFAAVAAMATGSHATAEAALPQVTAPTLVVMGTKDPDFPDPGAEAQLTADRLAGTADVVLVDGAGHYPHAQRADVVSPAITSFLHRVLPTSHDRQTSHSSTEGATRRGR